jgi:hypothetical protein
MKTALIFFISALIISGTSCKKSSKNPVIPAETVQDASIDIRFFHKI